MITSVFGKSRPFNYILLSSLFVLCSILYLANKAEDITRISGYFSQFGMLLLLVVSLFITNFIAKRNSLTKDNSFAFLFFFTQFLYFPDVLTQPRLILALFFILLSLRKIFSFQSMIHLKSKIFDASFWILVATLFYFPSILFLILVFVAIAFHQGGDYRNWVIPFIAFGITAVITLFFSLLIEPLWIHSLQESFYFEINGNLPEMFIEQFVLGVYLIFLVLFFISLLMSISRRPLILLNAFKKVIFLLQIGAGVVFFSVRQLPESMIFLFFPMAILAAAHTEFHKGNFTHEIISVSFVGVGILVFLLQL
jgi:hypothetical protein